VSGPGSRWACLAFLRCGTDFRVGAPAITWSCLRHQVAAAIELRVDHHPVPERNRSCSLLFSYCNLASLPPRARYKTSFKLQHKTNTTYALQSQSFPPSLPRSFPPPSPFHFSSCVLGQHLSTQKPLPHSSRTLPPLYPFSPSFMYFPFRSFLITGTSEARCY
jgi:hypothetical protein